MNYISWKFPLSTSAPPKKQFLSNWWSVEVGFCETEVPCSIFSDKVVDVVIRDER